MQRQIRQPHNIGYFGKLYYICLCTFCLLVNHVVICGPWRHFLAQGPKVWAVCGSCSREVLRFPAGQSKAKVSCNGKPCGEASCSYKVCFKLENILDFFGGQKYWWLGKTWQEGGCIFRYFHRDTLKLLEYTINTTPLLSAHLLMTPSRII